MRLNVVVQPFWSTTVAVYSPGAKPVICQEVDVYPPGPLQATLYGGVPPAGVRMSDPFEAPAQLVLLPPAKVPAATVAASAGGPDKVTLAVREHPCASVATSVYVPLTNPVRFAVVAVNPLGPFHE